MNRGLRLRTCRGTNCRNVTERAGGLCSLCSREQRRDPGEQTETRDGETVAVGSRARRNQGMWPPMPRELHIRTTPALRRHLERLAEARNTTLSGAIKAAVMEASFPDRGIPGEREVLELLGEAARAGSVPAMKELLTYHREQREGENTGALSVVDELAAKRVGMGVSA